MFNIENRRYMGNKTKLMSAIKRVVEEKCEGGVFLDLFGGTGVVTSHFLNTMSELIINDILISNVIVYKAFYGLGTYDMPKLYNYINDLKYDIIDIKPNYFSETYGNRYFRMSDALKIGYIRDKIDLDRELFTDKEYSILLASLLYSTDRISNTVGHYEAFLREEQNTKPKFKYDFVEPFNLKENLSVKIYQDDSNNLVKILDEVDITFIDPPYNSRDYGQYYHVLEQLVSWNKLEVKGKTVKPIERTKSAYCTNTAKVSFSELVAELKTKYIIVTYNNSFSTSPSSRNKITYAEMVEILSSKGELEIVEEDFKPFNSGKTNIEDHKELIFIVKVGG